MTTNAQVVEDQVKCADVETKIKRSIQCKERQ